MLIVSVLNSASQNLTYLKILFKLNHDLLESYPNARGREKALLLLYIKLRGSW